jgi:hypothetical protein
MYYKVTIRRVRVTIVAMENHKYYKFWVCVCSLSYPACNAHVPYYIVICGGLSGCTVFFYVISPTARFRRKKRNMECVFLFSLHILSETFLILNIIQRDIIINVHRSSCNVQRSSCNVHRSSCNVHRSSCNVHRSSCNVPVILVRF